MNQFLVDIALPVPLEQTFTYVVSPELQPQVRLGCRALVPFGKKYLTGVIVGHPSQTTVSGLKPVKDILDAEPTFSEEMLKLSKWMSEYYFAPWGEVLRAATPQGYALESKKTVRLVAADIEPLLASIKKSAPKQYAILRILEKERELTVARLQKKAKSKSIHAVINEMLVRGWISVEEHIQQSKVRAKFESVVSLTSIGTTPLSDKKLPPKQATLLEEMLRRSQSDASPISVDALLKQLRASLSSLKGLEKKGLVRITKREVIRADSYETDEPLPNITLNKFQQEALDSISAALKLEKYKTFLLHGITGSGKTQVYIEAIRAVLAAGKTAIVLVPEISLTPQTVRRFKAHFGKDVAVMHSQMSIGERYDAWRQAHQQKIKIVIGPRSAIFAPLRNIGLIVVDEEHEASYKQFDATPRYNARDVAIVRASYNNAVVVLGSATPSVESYYNALSGKYDTLELPTRVDQAKLPSIDIVDMAKERKRVYEDLKEEVKAKQSQFPKRLPPASVSKLLKDQIAERLGRKEGVILLQNRRGFSHVVECFECGYVEKCDNCEVTLTYHEAKKHLRCHYCGFVKRPPTVCPKCQGTEIRFHAFGTQQVQGELQEIFPKATVLRMDMDTTSRKGAHDRLLKQFGSGEADILLGTQMVAKGLDFPRVTLVGVISADTQMLLPDFRASERTFQLLTQVAGRAGRSNLA
ncbi:MAG: primosomal protein N', partial [Ignavibacteriales bacterium]|nr:primosomal protein N' [Ignavibacteriales bacterium]